MQGLRFHRHGFHQLVGELLQLRSPLALPLRLTAPLIFCSFEFRFWLCRSINCSTQNRARKKYKTSRRRERLPSQKLFFVNNPGNSESSNLWTASSETNLSSAPREWHYQRSDDPTMYRRGAASMTALWAIERESPSHGALISAWSMHAHSPLPAEQARAIFDAARSEVLNATGESGKP